MKIRKEIIGLWMLICILLCQGIEGSCEELREGVNIEIETEPPNLGEIDPEEPDPENPDPENPDPENPDPEEPDPEEPEDTKAPLVRATWKDSQGTLIENYYQTGATVALEVVIEEEHLDKEGTKFYLTATDYSGGEVSCEEVSFLHEKSLKELEQLLGDELREGDNCPIEISESENIVTLSIQLRTQAHYTLSAVVMDEAGNYAKECLGKYEELCPLQDTSEGGEKFILGTCCLDRTPPEIKLKEGDDGRPTGDITWRAQEESFFKKMIRGVTFGYFCKPEIEVRIQAFDEISGVESITYTLWELADLKDKEEAHISKTVTAHRGEILQEEEGSNRAYVAFTIPDSFQGTIKAIAKDQAGNEMGSWTETVGLLAESDEIHRQNVSLEVIFVEGEGKKEHFYRGDVRVNVNMKDTFSGIGSVTFQAGEQEERLSFAEKEQEVVTETEHSFTIQAAGQNQNQIPVSLELTDLAGHKTKIASVPEIHIDTVAPRVEVEWINTDARNEKYYRADRTAVITVTERNFDPTDVQMELTGMEVHELSWFHQKGDGCEGSENPDHLGHSDTCAWITKVVFDRDGEYTFGFSLRDAAGNQGSYGKVESFIIDKTPPVIQVSWNQVQAHHEKYYGQERKAVIDILEQNFRPEDGAIKIQASHRGLSINPPRINPFQEEQKEGWSQEKAQIGKTWQTEAVFDFDGLFQLQAECMDLAGNMAKVYLSEEFVIDLTPPQILFFDVEDRSANNGTVSPRLEVQDTNYDGEQLKIRFEGSNGQGRIPDSSKESSKYNLSVKWKDFERVPENDDLYRITAEAADLAGNKAEAELLFSVNRFGSVYVLEQETEKLAGPGGTYYTNLEPEIIIEEYNVDLLEGKKVTYSRDGEVVHLQEGEDYTTEFSGSEDTWKTYRYEIRRQNFQKDGTYVITLYSEDRASNISTNRIKEKTVEFMVDKTKPSVVITGVEENGKYRGYKREIQVDIKDQMILKGARVYLNDECVAESAQEDLRENHGFFTVTASKSDEWQSVKVEAWDAAGNVTKTEKIYFFVASPFKIHIPPREESIQVQPKSETTLSSVEEAKTSPDVILDLIGASAGLVIFGFRKPIFSILEKQRKT